MPSIIGRSFLTILLGTGINTGASILAYAVPAPAFSELLRQTQERAPRLAEGQAGVSQAQGLRTQAGARPNPSLSVEIENFGGSGALGGFSRAETTYGVSQPIEFWGKREARVRAGEAGVAAAQARMEQTRADFAYDLANAYIEAEAFQNLERLAQDTLKLAQDDARVARVLVQSGREAQFRQVQADAAAAVAQAALESAVANRERAFARLSALAAAPEPYTSISISLLDHANVYETPQAPDPLKSPAYRAALSARDAAESRIEVERTRPLPDVNLSLGFRTFSGTKETALVGGLSIPVPIFDSNRGNISAAQAELSAATARMVQAQNDAQAEARAAVARARAALARITAAQDGERTAEEAYRLTRAGYEGGKLTFIEVLNSSRALAEARRGTIDARLERLNAEAALARLQGIIPFGDH